MSYSGLKIKTKSKNSTIKNCTVSYLAGIIIFLLILTIASFIILNIHIEHSHFYLFVMLASSVSAFFASLLTSVFVSKNRLAASMGVASVLVISEFLVLLCFNNISLSSNIYLLFPIAVFFGFTGSIIGINIKKK